MLSFSTHQRYFLFSKATDMRKGFSGLSGLVRKHIPHDLMSGDVFIFINKKRDKIKLLLWDSNGFAIWYKELEKGAVNPYAWMTDTLNRTGNKPINKLSELLPDNFRNYKIFESDEYSPTSEIFLITLFCCIFD